MKYMTWLLLSAVVWSQGVTFLAEPPEPVFTMSLAYCEMIMWRGTDHLLHVKHSCSVPVELAVLPDQIPLMVVEGFPQAG